MVCAAFLPSPRALGCAIIRVCLRLSRRLLRPPSANAFPELRRRASAALPPVQPVASAHRAGWYSRRNGQPVKKDVAPSRAPWWQGYKFDLPTGPAPFPAGLEVK